MTISAAQVKELRDISGVGMMECKKALTETDGDVEKALDLLRSNSALKAFKALLDLKRSSAFSTSPSVSVSAFLHSIIPTPDMSLSSFTWAAEIVMFLLPLDHFPLDFHLALAYRMFQSPV